MSLAPAKPLYGDVIRDRWRRPRFRGDLTGANAVAEDVNPLCGDRVRMMLLLGDDRVEAARFIGDSCAICTASADVLAEMVEGRRRAEALALTPADVLEILAADIRPTRMRCVTLPLTVLASALSAERSTEPSLTTPRHIPPVAGHPRPDPGSPTPRHIPPVAGHPRPDPGSPTPLQ